jgi:ABC-type bacteriocin/lantibiotic exporter with double-glycine peptidase domain
MNDKNNIIEFIALYFKPQSSKLILGTISIFFLSLLILPTPLITRRILDKSLPNKNLQELILLVLIVFGLLLVMRVIGYFQGLLFYKINSKVILDIRLDLLKKMNKLPLKISKKYSTGYLISRINDDTGRLQSLFADTIINIAKDVLTFLVGLTAIFFIHWKLALVSIIILPFYILFTIHFSKKVREQSKMYYEDSAQTTRQLEESLNMLELSKIFLRYKYNLLRYYQKAKKAFRSDIKLGRTSYLNSTIVGFIGGIAPIAIIGYGGYEIIQGRLTIGSLIAFNSFVGYLFGPASRLINVNISIQKALIALQRVQELFDLPEEEFAKEFEISESIEQVAFENISFSYEQKALSHDNNEVNQKSIEDENDKENILRNISLIINKGEKIGIVGGSGSGKTTLLRMLSGLYEPDEGSILLNNKKLANGEIAAFRKYIAVVEQEPFLFSDTIFNNIRFGNTRATEEEIISAAKLSHCSEFIEKLENDYQTEVGNKGGNLSVGQKQRLAIARALVKNPKILILDEATSNIDAISEKFIMDTIYNLPEDMLVIIVAHRLSTIRYCDKIVILENGEIIESGSHELLIEKAGKYYELCKANA